MMELRDFVKSLFCWHAQEEPRPPQTILREAHDHVLPGYIRIVCVGNTFSEQTYVPPGDILIHTGNFTLTGDSYDGLRSLVWLHTLPHRYKIIIPGENEIDTFSHLSQNLPPGMVLLDGETVYACGLRIHSGMRISEREGKSIFTCSPISGIHDIVISHIPPCGILDQDMKGSYTGSRSLAEGVTSLPPTLCVFGRAPESAGHLRVRDTLHVNACVMGKDSHGHLKHAGSPVIVDILPRRVY